MNEGILYRNQIEEQLKSLVDFDQIKITFEHTKFIEKKQNDIEKVLFILFFVRALIEFPSPHSIREMIHPTNYPINQIISSTSSQTNIHPAVYFAVKAR